jgi:hypothetical protein
MTGEKGGALVMNYSGVTYGVARCARARLARYGAAASMFVSLVCLFTAVVGSAQAADSGCAGLGGTESGGECQIAGLHTVSGPFDVGLKLHILDGGILKTGAAGITLSINGGLIMDNGGQIDADVPGCSPSSNKGGPVNITVTSGNINLLAGSSIHSNSCTAGSINITGTAPGAMTIDGTVASIGSLTGTGTHQAPGGGPIFIKAGCVLTVGDNGLVTSQGKDPGADLVHLEGCSVSIFGVVESTGAGHAIPDSPPNSCSDKAAYTGTRRNSAVRTGKPQSSTGCVEIWAGNTVVISSADGHSGEVSADIGTSGGSMGRGWIDILARGTINIADGAGNDPKANEQIYAVHANGGLNQNTDDAGLINIRSLGGDVVASGNAIQASSTNAGGSGGEIHVEALNNVTFDNATIEAQGDVNGTGGFGKGGRIGTDSSNGWQQKNEPIIAYKGLVSWANGVGDVRPTGTNANLATANRGVIALKSCQGIDTASTTFSNNGLPNTVPTSLAPSCSAAGPVLPAYVNDSAFPRADCLTYCSLKAKKRGMKFNDLAGNHVKDPGDPGLPNWEIKAFNSQGLYVGSAITDSSGHYEFQLMPGNYTFCEVWQSGWTQTFPVPGDPTAVATCPNLSGDLEPVGYNVTLAAGQVDDGNDFGNYMDPPSCPEDPKATITMAVDDTGAAHGTVPVFTTVQAAYDNAPNGAVIGLFSNTSENVVLGGSKTLKITQCTTARVYALDNSKPVWTLSSTGALTVVSPDAVGGSIGWLIQGDDNDVKSVRSTGASQYGMVITGNDNRVSFNSVTGSPVGVRIEGIGNDVRGGTVSGNYGNGVEIANTGSLNAFQTANVTGNGGNGILVEGSNNTVSSNGRVDSNKLNGILVSGANNTIKNNAAGSDKAVGNGQDGFRVSGAGNLLQDNKANANQGNGFTVTAAGTGTKLKNNQSNASSSGGNKENAGNEYQLDAAAIDQGSNKADTISIPKASAPQKCASFPKAGTLCE